MTTAAGPTSLQKSQLDEASAMLGRAFFDDPLNVYVFPDEAKRASVLPWFLRGATDYGIRYGEVHATPESVDGVAAWLPPRGAFPSMLRMALTGMFAAPFKAGLSASWRFLNISVHLEKLHKRDVPEDHWYLMVLGVDTDKQGQGIGSSLVAPMFARADADGLPCYLETMKERNVVFYEKHGFQVVVEDDLPNSGPHFWTMKRPARAS